MTRQRLGLWLAISSLLCAHAQQPNDGYSVQDNVPFLEGDPNFLFLGNSYTSQNDLAYLVTNLLEAGVPEWDGKVQIQKRDPGGERFPGHLEETKGNQVLNQWLVNPATRWKWKWVILQDQSQVPGFVGVPGNGPGGREYKQSLQAARSLNQLIQDNGAQTLFLQTWGRRHRDDRNPNLFSDFPTMQAHITEGYRTYWQATTTDSRPTYVAPAGLVYQTIYDDLKFSGKDPTSPGSLFHELYQSDGSHPSIAGSYLAALTIYTTITGKNPKLVAWFPSELDPIVGTQLQDAVNRTILQTHASHTIEYPWHLPWPNHDPSSMEL